MAHVTQAEFCRAIRGGAVVVGAPPPVQPLVLGLSAIARAAVRRVHNQSPAAAIAYFDQKASGYLQAGGAVAATAHGFRDSVDRYIQWDGSGNPAQLDVKGLVLFGAGNSVRALGHVVLDDGTGVTYEARLLIWDDLLSTTAEAEQMALPVLECVEAQLGAGSVSQIDVWQLATNLQHAVAPPAARSHAATVTQFLAQM